MTRYKAESSQLFYCDNASSNKKTPKYCFHSALYPSNKNNSSCMKQKSKRKAAISMIEQRK